MFNKYYQDELIYLRDSGREFADANPEAARFLAQPGTDPDVERMLEGFAFLTAKLRQKLDDELPELTHSFTEMFWPHYLRPVPSTTTMQFAPLPVAAGEIKHVPRGTMTDSAPIDGTRCRFATTSDITLLPIEIRTLELRRESPPRLSFSFDVPGKLALDKLDIQSIRLHFSGEPLVTRALNLTLNRFVKRVVVRDGSDASRRFELPPNAVQPVGFTDKDAVLGGPGPSFPGFRLLQEYFACPHKFMYCDVTGLAGLAKFVGSKSFHIEFELRRLPENMPPVSKANVLVNCAPAVNLFAHDADPIRVDVTRTEYNLRPTGRDPAHYDVFSVDKVFGLVSGTAETREYRQQYKLPRSGKRGELYYHVRRYPPVVGSSTRLSMTLIEPEHDRPKIENVSIELTCTNGALPSRLDSGDLKEKSTNSPLFASYRNVGRPTPTIPAPLRDDLLWRMMAHLSLNYLSLVNIDALRTIVGLYNFRAGVDRQAEQAHMRLLEGIREVKGSPGMRLFQGLPVRGIEVELTLDEDLLGGEGELFLFGSVLDVFFAQYVSLNSFSRLTVKGNKLGEVYAWPARIGLQAIL